MPDQSVWFEQYRVLRRSLEIVRILAGAAPGIEDALQVLWWAMSDDEHALLRADGFVPGPLVSTFAQVCALRDALSEVCECERAKACFEGLPFDHYRALIAQVTP